jgi:hypothetical protein
LGERTVRHRRLFADRGNLRILDQLLSMIATGGLYKRQGLLLNRGQVSDRVHPESWPLFRSREVTRKLPTDRFAPGAAACRSIVTECGFDQNACPVDPGDPSQLVPFILSPLSALR